MIISFANQKGGVGKSTLCGMFANYLAKRGINVLVVDIDRQRTLYSQRKSDRGAFTDQEELYNIEEFDLENKKNSETLVSQIKSINGVILLDTPGSITEDGLIPIFANSDYIICPYLYEKKVLDSTGVFIQVIMALKSRIKEMDPTIFYIPNQVDKRVGTKEELFAFSETDKVFEKFGIVTPSIPNKVALKRSNTYVLTPPQEEAVMECFDFIIDKIGII
ncbi:chromosome partitioning protein ParA [Bacteroidia bacterium]|nr:chromosome partitioning protein ParA [Bacteroidia bacterium]GHT61602.1 chromosome partitioning protein ParA [Bacteroidia bacterium]